MHRTARSTGQSVYEVMLILSCAAMALAVFFAAYEYVSYYHGEAKPVPQLGSAGTGPKAAPRAAAPTTAPATSAVPATSATPAPATTH
jgi:hypothetical protein